MSIVPDIGEQFNRSKRRAAESTFQCPKCYSQSNSRGLWKHIVEEHGDIDIAKATAKERSALETKWLISSAPSLESSIMPRWQSTKVQNSPKEALVSPKHVISPTAVTVDPVPLNALDALSIEREDKVMVDAPAPMSPSSAEPPPSRKNRQTRERKTELAQRPPPSMDLFDPNGHEASRPSAGNHNYRGERRATIDSGAAPSQDRPRGDKKSSGIQTSSRKQRQDAPPSANAPAPPVILKHEPGVASMPTQTSTNHSKFAGSEDDDENIEMIRQPETRPISQDQLVAEVKGIYAGLVMVEAKCIEVDTKQAQVAMKMESDKSIAQPRLNNEQWQALIALHRTLLHEHHDFLLASQHPSASLSLRKLASKYAMPARMWRHGIHSFLELLRHRLPASFEHMLTFIYLAYSMMALLYETIPAFADTWVECLGDLSRYRMAIEEGDVRDREVWTNVSRFWYSKGADRTPSVGRLYHHLAILSRPYILQQMFYYSKSLIVGLPFLSARESIITLFDPAIIRSQQGGNDKSQTTDLAFIKVHSLLFQAINVDAYDVEKSNYHDLLDKRIGELETQFKIQGVYVAICNIAAIWQYGSKTAQMKLLCKDREEPKPDGDAIKEEPVEVEFLSAGAPKRVIKIKLYTEGSAAEIALQNSIDFAMSTLELVLDRENDANCHPHILVFLVLFNHLMEYAEAMAMIVDYVPWKSLVETMNFLMAKKEQKNYQRILDSANFPVNERSIGRPLAEDFLLRGLDITKQYFPPDYFQRVQVDDEERFQELPSFVMVREERLLWLMVRFAKGGPWVNFDEENHSFAISLELEDAIREHRDQVRGLSQRPVPEREDPDVEMETAPPLDEEDSFDEAANENTEMGQLISTQKALQAKLNEPQISQAEEISKKSSQGLTKECFKPNYTTVVVDTNSLVKNLDVYKNMILQNNWPIVIPYSVLTELNGLIRNEGTVAKTSQAALQCIEKALAEKKKVRVITAKGTKVNYIKANYKELLDSYRSSEGGGRQNLDDIIINTAKQQGELVVQKLGVEGEENNVKPVVLITDDQVMRVKGYARGVTCLSTKGWVKIIEKADDGATNKRKIAQTFQVLKQRFPKFDEDTLWEAVREADGNEISASELLQKDGRNKRLKNTPEGDGS